MTVQAQAAEYLRSRKLQVQFSTALSELCHEIEIKSDCDIDEFSLISISQLIGSAIRSDNLSLEPENLRGILIDYQIVRRKSCRLGKSLA